jgi:antirestriction protein ArdC
MRRFLARFSEPVWSGHVPSWADFITTTPELKFSVHTGAFLCADLELTPEPRSDYTSYLDHLLRVLKSDSQAIFAAASHAQRAAHFLLGLQSNETVEVAA